jgi:hypothetical protein
MTQRSSALIALVAATGLSFAAVGAAQSAQSTSADILEIEWDDSLETYQFDNDKFIGQRFTAKCIPANIQDMDETVFGTDTYPSDSSICVAAVHAGLIDRDGGVVTVQLNPGADEYVGSSRNGIDTQSLPATQRSMIFVTGPEAGAVDEVQMDYVPRIDWDTKFTATGLAYEQLVGQHFLFSCPAAPNNLTQRRVVGTDSYAFNSMVCRAAVHAGAITTDGGLVTVQLDPGADKLVGSIRNGIESKDGPGGHRTLSFVETTVQN